MHKTIPNHRKLNPHNLNKLLPVGRFDEGSGGTASSLRGTVVGNVGGEGFLLGEDRLELLGRLVVQLQLVGRGVDRGGLEQGREGGSKGCREERRYGDAITHMEYKLILIDYIFQFNCVKLKQESLYCTDGLWNTDHSSSHQATKQESLLYID